MNLLLGTHLMSDGSIVWTAGGAVGGIANPLTPRMWERTSSCV